MTFSPSLRMNILMNHGNEITQEPPPSLAPPKNGAYQGRLKGLRI